MKLQIGTRRIEISLLGGSIVAVRCPTCGKQFHIGRDAFEGNRNTKCTNEDCRFDETLNFAEAVEKLKR